MSLDKTASTAGADVTVASDNPSTAAGSLTKRQQFWLDHLRRCDAKRIPTKTYAQQHGLSVQAMYSARKGLVERGLLHAAGGEMTAASSMAGSRANSPRPCPPRMWMAFLMERRTHR